MDQEDFSAYRVLILGGKTFSISVLRSILGVLGVTHVFQVQETRRAIELLSMEMFTVVFYDPKSENYDDMSFPVAARRKKSMLNPIIPILALQDRPRRRDVEQARDVGVTDVITTPISPTTIMKKLRAAPRPFIVAPEFFGPDRRAKARAPWSGSDRRKRIARKQKIDFISI